MPVLCVIQQQSASEMADTTEASNNTVLMSSAESEREAVSMAPVDVVVEPVVEVRRETEPVTTSLSMEEHSRGALLPVCLFQQQLEILMHWIECSLLLLHSYCCI
jgi:hypothetical protein